MLKTPANSTSPRHEPNGRRPGPGFAPKPGENSLNFMLLTQAILGIWSATCHFACRRRLLLLATSWSRRSWIFVGSLHSISRQIYTHKYTEGSFLIVRGFYKLMRFCKPSFLIVLRISGGVPPGPRGRGPMGPICPTRPSSSLILH